MRNILLFLPEDIKQALEKIVRATTSQMRMVFRARIILMALEDRDYAEIIRHLKTTYVTVRKWVTRFCQKPTLDALEDAPRSGRPLTIPAVAKCEVVKFACSDIRT